MSNAALIPETRLKRLWLTWRFHLSALLVLIPLGFMPAYFHDVSLDRGLQGLGERVIGQYPVGPWTARIAEWELHDPQRDGKAGYMKETTLAFCAECIGQVKAAYLRIGKPRSLRAAGSLLSGSPYRLFAEVRIPPGTTADDALWLTVEGWDGSVHQASIPLKEVSPSMIEWLARNGDTL